MSVKVTPIQSAHVPAVADFLYAHLNARISAVRWQAAMRVPWPVEAPNYGFMLTENDSIVGVHLAFYAERVIAGRAERFCNLGAWCVLPGYRAHSVRLLRALLAQDGYHFTDLSPSGAVRSINERLNFTSLDTATALVPNVPAGRLARRATLTANPAELAARLTGRDLRVYLDHRHATAARHLLIRRGGEHCYLMFRKVRRKNLPVFAAILHASNPRLLHASLGQVRCRLLLRHGALATLAELRTIERKPLLSVLLPAPRPKMYRSPTLAPDQIDDLYSELACVPW
jgi:hypothetical protein